MKGYEQNKQRLNTISSFGKDLARRAKSKCELTGESGVPLVIFEVPPFPNDPDFDRCLFISQTAAEQIAKPKKLNPDDWHSLRELIWSEHHLVQLMAHRILTHIAKTQPWAQTILDDAYLDPELITESETHPIS